MPIPYERRDEYLALVNAQISDMQENARALLNVSSAAVGLIVALALRAQLGSGPRWITASLFCFISSIFVWIGGAAAATNLRKLFAESVLAGEVNVTYLTRLDKRMRRIFNFQRLLFLAGIVLAAAAARAGLH